MTFLNGVLLGGLVAGSIPVILHLWHRSRFQTVRWGAMHLLEQVLKTNRRRIRIEQWILLALRTLILCLLALVMARPVLTGMTALLGNAKTSTVVLLDASYSMEARSAGGSNFDTARSEAVGVLKSAPAGSENAVLLMGQKPLPLLDGPTFDPDHTAQQLAKASAGFGVVAISDAILAASDLSLHYANRDLVIVSDFQKTSWGPDTENSRREAFERLRQLPVPPNLTFLRTGAQEKTNVAVESIDFPRLTIGVGQKVHFRANLRNYGEAAYPDLRVYFKADGIQKAATSISLGAGERGQVLFSHAFEKAGSHFVEVVADADSLKADNAFLASLPVRDRIPVLLVNGDPNAEPLRGETDFLQVALQPFSAAKVKLADLISARVIPINQLAARELQETAVVVLANVPRLDARQLRDLEDYVRNGGGLLIFPGDRVATDWYNRTLFNQGRGLLPAPLQTVAGEVREGGPGAAILAQHFEHPALELFNDPRNGNLAEAEVRLWFRFGPSEATITLARLSTNDPLFLEKEFGAGRVITAAVPADADWTNFPTRPFYLPLMQNLAVYLASRVHPPRNLQPGEMITAFLPGSMAGKQATLTTPAGASLQLPVLRKGERGLVEFGGTHRDGLYVLTPPGGEPLHYAVNASRRESDLSPIPEAELSKIAEAAGARLVHSWQEYNALDQARRHGREIWKPLFWLLLGTVFLEMILAQRFGRRRTP